MALGNAKIFMYSETISNLLMLGLNIVGYKLGGLRGLGICFTLGFVAYTFIAYLFANRTIGFKLFKDSLNDYKTNKTGQRISRERLICSFTRRVIPILSLLLADKRG